MVRTKEQYQKYRDKILRQKKEYWKKNKDELKFRKREDYRKNRDKYLLQKKIYREKVENEKDKIFGNKCKICGSIKKRMLLHEIHGEKHSIINSIKKLQSINFEDYIRLCQACHVSLHRFMIKNIDLKMVVDLINKRK